MIERAGLLAPEASAEDPKRDELVPAAKLDTGRGYVI